MLTDDPRLATQQLLADTAHQLRTQLQLLVIRLDRLGGYLAPEGRPVYARLMADLDRLGGTLDELLRLGEAADRGGAAAVDVSSVLAERVEAWTEVAVSRGLELRLVGAAPAHAHAHAGTVAQVVDILLDNAIKYSRPPGRITAAVRRAEGTVTVQVVDQGPGMTAEERSAAVGRGWRGSAVPGHGLGLAIAERLAASTGGRLGIAAGPQGRGLDARVEFPVVGTPPFP